MKIPTSQKAHIQIEWANNNNNINFIEPINAEANKTMFYTLQDYEKML